MDSSSEDIIYSGLLKKKGGRVNVWGERYFVLKGYTLFYYVKSTDSVSKVYMEAIIPYLTIVFRYIVGIIGAQRIVSSATDMSGLFHF